MQKTCGNCEVKHATCYKNRHYCPSKQKVVWNSTKADECSDFKQKDNIKERRLKTMLPIHIIEVDNLRSIKECYTMAFNWCNDNGHKLYKLSIEPIMNDKEDYDNNELYLNDNTKYQLYITYIVQEKK